MLNCLLLLLVGDYAKILGLLVGDYAQLLLGLLVGDYAKLLGLRMSSRKVFSLFRVFPMRFIVPVHCFSCG